MIPLVIFFQFLTRFLSTSNITCFLLFYLHSCNFPNLQCILLQVKLLEIANSLDRSSTCLSFDNFAKLHCLLILILFRFLFDFFIASLIACFLRFLLQFWKFSKLTCLLLAIMFHFPSHSFRGGKLHVFFVTDHIFTTFQTSRFISLIFVFLHCFLRTCNLTFFWVVLFLQYFKHTVYTFSNFA